jgi:hypothetical protein
MRDSSAFLRLIDEMLWSLRREGLSIATSQAIDCARAVHAVGWEHRDTVFEAIACVVCQSASDRLLVRQVFDRMMCGPRSTLWDRLERSGFTKDELALLRELLAELAKGDVLEAFADRGAELDRLLQLAAVAMVEMQGPLQAGFFGHRVLERAGHRDARAALDALRIALRDALGARGDALADALGRELDDAAREVREYVRRTADKRAERREAKTLDQKPLVSLDPAEMQEVRRAVRSFAARLRGRERVRRRRARFGRIDPHRALRRALRTGGVPFVLPRKRRRKDKPRLFVLCDISDSVRRASTFLLEFVYFTHDLFERTRSFVFVSDIGESTRIFEEKSPEAALPFVFGGGIVPVTSNSSYGRVLRAFCDAHLGAIDKRTTIVILGDGRTNYAPDGLDALAELRARAASVLWLCPEPRSEWGTGDSAMMRYMTVASETFSVSNARELEAAARRIVARR